MTERRRGSKRRSTTTEAARPDADTLYESVLDAVDPRTLAVAREARGLDDELTVVRLLLRRQLAGDPDNLDLMIKGMHLLVRMVAAQHHLSEAEAAALSEGAKQAIKEFSTNILGEGAADG